MWYALEIYLKVSLKYLQNKNFSLIIFYDNKLNLIQY